MIRFKSSIAENQFKENQLHQIAMYPDEAQRQLEYFNHAHLSGEEAYNKYAVDRSTKILNFHKRVDFLKSFIPSKLHQSASKVVPHAHVDDAGLHHFNAIPKDTFIKHWNSITTKNGT